MMEEDENSQPLNVDQIQIIPKSFASPQQQPESDDNEKTEIESDLSDSVKKRRVKVKKTKDITFRKVDPIMNNSE